MTIRFSGFPRQMPRFFRALEKNNRRDWFNPRKETFETHVRAPMIELVTHLNDKLRATVGADHVADQPARLIYRIYRDTRFSADKTPYKTHIAATFAHRKLPRHAGAGYYIEISHEHVGIAGGVYMPGPEELNAIRSAIAAHPKRFLEIVNNPRLKRLFGPLQGERLRRLPKPWQNDGDSPATEYLKFKQFYWWAELPAKLALTPRLAPTLWRHFEALTDGIAWFNKVILADRQEQDEDSHPVRPEPMW
jgi:uncharacterized protein (TIGR02453 family)